jgi:hypothetical protein
MGFQLPQMPDFNVKQTPMPDALSKMGQMVQLKDMLSGNALRQQLAPLQVQEQQQRVQQETTANQLSQMKLASTQARVKAWSDPEFVNSFMGGSNSALENSLGFSPGFDPLKMIKGEVSRGVHPDDAMAEASSFLELSKNLSLKTKDDLANYKSSHEEAANILAPVLDMKASEAGPAFEAAKQKIASIPGLDPQDAKFVQQASLDHVPALVQRLGIAGKLADYHKGQAEASAAESEANIKKMEAAEKGSPLTKMENDPTMLAGDKLPASMAYLQGKVNDSDPAVAARAMRLLSTAKTAQSVQLAMEAAKKATDQAIQDGDPAAAAKLLVDGTVAPSQLISSRKPEFAQKAFTIAVQLQNGWDARKAEADFKVASSPAQIAFFGSAKSLTDKGGTLDQLKAAGDDIPQNQFPVFNTVADAIKASTGSGPIAKYASIALGVADDYSKVMGGGQGSDTSRLQALKLISAKESPEQRAASIEGIRGAVGSQTNSRIGNNPVLQKMYGGTAPQPAKTTKVLTSAQIQQAAKDHGVSVDEAKRSAQAAGYEVK